MKLYFLILFFFAFVHVNGSVRPNVLFIVSDDQGWGDFPSNWDGTEVQLPVLDKLADQGARFSNYHTVPLCAPSRACMFTGQYSSENGMWRGNKGIKKDVKMLSEYFSEAGYATGCYGKWHMGSNIGGLPNDRGFDEFRGFLSGTHGYWVTKQRNRILHNGKPDDSEGHTTELFTQWSENFIRKSVAQKKPFFCYLAYNAVHGPIRTDESKPASAPKEWVDKALARGVSFLRSDYVAILEHMDYNIGKLIDLIDELKVSNNTLVVFVSDNGGCTMEGNFGGRYPGNNGPFRGSKATTYQGGLNVPFLINWKGRVQEGMASDDQVMHCDVFATLLDAVGIPLPEMNGQNPMRGMSLLPHMKSGGKQPIPERSMIFELWGNIGLRKGDYKLWANVGREFTPDWQALANKLKSSELALFDLGKDPSESIDLRERFPKVYDSLKQELVDHFANINAEYPTKETHPELFAPEKKGSETPKKLASGSPKSPLMKVQESPFTISGSQMLKTITNKASKPESDSESTNFLIIVVDDMGYGDLSKYQHSAKDAHTPNLDALASRGTLYTQAYVSAAVCSPSRAGWITGRHQARWDPKSGFNCGLPKGIPTLASILRENGYKTAKIGKNDFGNRTLHRQDVYAYPLNHGYDEFLGFSAHGFDYFLLSKDIQNRTPDPKGHSAALGPLMRNRGHEEFKPEGDHYPYLTEVFTKEAIHFLHENKNDPFLLTLSYNSVHHLIHQVPPRYINNYAGLQPIPHYDPNKDGKYAQWFKQFITIGEKISAKQMRDYYLANLDCLDENIGVLMDALDELKLTDNTMVVFFSDNGGAPTNGATNLPLAGSKFTLWEGGIRVPFILSRPGDPHGGQVSDQVISSLDIVPTCLDAARIRLPADLDGKPIVQSEEPRNLFWRFGETNSHAFRSGDWKLLHNGGRKNREPTEGIVNRENLLKGTRLFNLKNDPGESKDLSKDRPKVLKRLRELYGQWSSEIASQSLNLEK